jgi:8-oxo-dGTP diphosphatase
MKEKIEETQELRYKYRYPMAALTVDAVVFGYDPKGTANPLKVLMIKRGVEPFKDFWAIPGGYVDIEKGETIEAAVRRELKEETGMDLDYLEQLYTFADPDRDPRGRVVSVAHFALVRRDQFEVQGMDDASDARWFPIDRLLWGEIGLGLAFDHEKILRVAFQRLQAKVRYNPLGFNLLPSAFSLGTLRRMYEAILQRPLDKRNFRKKILSMKILVETGVRDSYLPGKATTYYSFNTEAYNLSVTNGFNFEI